TATTTVSTIIILPISSSMSTIGTNTTIVVNMDDITAPITSFVPKITASKLEYDCSFFLKIDSNTTIEASTIIPIPIPSPTNLSILILLSSYVIFKMVRNKEAGQDQQKITDTLSLRNINT